MHLSSPRRVLTIALLAGVTTLAGGAAAHAGTKPRHPRTASGQASWTCSNTHTDRSNCKTIGTVTIGGGDWADIDLGCPDHHPKPQSIKHTTTKSPDHLVVYGPYDADGSDGGHFWIRVNNPWPASREASFTWDCRA